MQCFEHVRTTRNDRLRTHEYFPRSYTLDKRTEEYNVRLNRPNKEGVLSQTDMR